MTKRTKPREEYLMANARRKSSRGQSRRFVQRYHREPVPRKPTQTESFDHFFHKLKSRAFTVAMTIVFAAWLLNAVVEEVAARYEAIKGKIVRLSGLPATVPPAEVFRPVLSNSSATSQPRRRDPGDKSEASFPAISP
jgi:hypothetical protein